MIDDHADLRRLHQGFLDTEHTSPGQKHDSQTIIALLDENARLREALEHFATDRQFPNQRVWDQDRRFARAALEGKV